MIEQGLSLYIFIILLIGVLLLATDIIPYYGFRRKRWKGLALGCLLQPIVCALIFMIVIYGVYYYQKYDFHRLRKSAMVSVKKTDEKGNTHFWHLKPDEECFYEFWKKDPDIDFLLFNEVNLYDVVPLDSFGVCVDDHIFVKFDMKGRKATATCYEEPMEVVDVDWEKVNNFFKDRH